jgi:serralysin
MQLWGIIMAATSTSYSTYTGDIAIDNLLGGSKWATTTLTYGFPTSASSWTGYGGADTQHPYQGFSTCNEAQIAAAEAALQSWANVANLSFVRVSEPGTIADIRFANSSVPPTAEAYFPSNDPTGGDVWLGPSHQGTSWIPGTDNWSTMPHELGHALGLKHPHDSGGGAQLDPAVDSIELSIMSYRSYAGASVSGGYVITEGSYPSAPMLNDIAAIQYLYGANYGYNAGNTVYTYTPATAKILETIWDGGGTDTYDLSAYTTSVTVSLVPGQWSTFSSGQLASLNNADPSVVARGNVANAYLHNNDTRSLIENVTTGSGNDAVTGNDADNVVFGGAGSDTAWGGNGNDQLYGNFDSDLLYGEAGDDLLFGGQGSDVVFGSVGNDQLYGNMMNDVVYGEAGDDSIFGGQGNDQLFGGQGNDFIAGNLGDDTMTGGVGADRFVFNGNDVVADFDAAGGDRLVLSAGVTYAVSAGSGGALVTFSTGATVTLTGVNAAEVTAGWFTT